MAKDIRVTLELDNSKFNRSINQSKTQVKGFEKSSVASLGSIRTAFLALGGAAVVKNIIAVGQSFQDLQTSLNFVTGGAENGAVAFDNLTKLATQTQFGVEELVQSFIILQGSGIKPTNDLFIAFADTAAVAQDQLGVLNSLVSLFSRVTSKGKLELEDLNKIADRGIPIFKILTDEFGKTIEEIKELAKTPEGQKELFAGIQSALEDTYGGLLQEKLKNSSIAFSNLEIAARRLASALFTSLGLDSTSAIEGLTDAINSLADNTAALESLGRALAGVGIALASFGALRGIRVAMNGLQKGITGVVQTIVGGGAAGGGILSALRQFIGTNVGGLVGLNGKIVDAAGKTTGLKRIFVGLGQGTFSIAGKFAALGRVLLRFAGPVGIAFAVVEGFNFLRKAFFGAEEATDELSTSLQNLNTTATETEEPLTKIKDVVGDFLKELDDKLVTIDNFNDAMKEVEHVFGGDKTVKGMADYNRAVQGVRNAFIDVVKPMEDAAEEARKQQEIQDELAAKLAQGEQAIQKFRDAFTGQALTTEELNEKQSELNALLSKYPELAEAIAKAQDDLDQAFSKNEGLNNFIDNLARAQKTLSDDLATALLEGEKPLEAFKDFFKSIISQILADIIRVQIIQPILSSIFGAFGMPISFGPGGSITRKKAVGGPVMKDTPYIVGERGPEMFVPNSAGSIMRNDLMGGGGSVTYNIQAVDARSFQQLVASDPEFIYSVTEAGRRRIPGRF